MHERFKTTPIAAKLRVSILQRAIEGKLVPQNPDDEPASKLVERIRADRTELIKQKKAKAPKGGESIIWKDDNGSWWERRGKGEAACIDDEIPFDIPENWVWTRMLSLCDFGMCMNIKYANVEVGTWNLDLEDLEKDTGKILRKKRKTDRDKGSVKHVFQRGMVLYSKLRPYLNKVTEADEDGVCTSEILPLTFTQMENSYIIGFFRSPYFLRFADSHTTGIKMPRLRVDDVKLLLVPIPPTEEQRRISMQIDAFSAMLDQLENLERERCCRFCVLAGFASHRSSVGCSR